MSSSLDSIVQVTISRDTVSVTEAGFGTYAILSEFDKSKTATDLERYRFYASLTEMESDNFSAGEPEYDAAQKVFSQNPKLSRIMIGRKDSTDASWTAAANAIQEAQKDWYSFMVVGYNATKAVFDSDFVTSNSIVLTVDGTAVSAVPFNTNQATTMADIKSTAEAEITNLSITIETTKDTDNRTLIFKKKGKSISSLSIVVTGGASQPVASITRNTTKVVFAADLITGNSVTFTINNEQGTAIPFNTNHATTMADIKTQIETDVADAVVTIDGSDANTRTLLIDLNNDNADVSVVISGGTTQTTATVTTDITDVYVELAAWVATQKKIFFYSSSMNGILGSGTTDVASIIKATNNDRVVSCYHSESQGDATPEYFEAAWPGMLLPKKPGSITWMFKTPKVLTADELESSEETNALGKFCNIFVTVAGVDITKNGYVADGTYIDERRGLDQLQAWLQEGVFALLASVDKVSYTDEGIGLIVAEMEKVFERASTQGILVAGSSDITIPLASSASSTQKQNRIAPDIPFTSTLQGAIHNVNITGVVSV
jgi:hypothetical protein